MLSVSFGDWEIGKAGKDGEERKKGIKCDNCEHVMPNATHFEFGISYRERLTRAEVGKESKQSDVGFVAGECKDLHVSTRICISHYCKKLDDL